MSNCSIIGKKLCFEPQNWLREIDMTLKTLCGAPVRGKTRTFEEIKEITEALDL